ncbi:gastrula zinc finger protein XlCGF26.1-like [Bradysia coprophila]|uniref:gastrula zinc finger protein XlCGF26.1-like n=1 Tax=Bradysia coprophila TaxID=38358 RepID=UPI00187D8F73|nr:gastrula zinc finger protein XlCGF26.1-like [Bradysia coprophila]
MPSKEILRRNRICIVPACKAVNSDFPDRIFFPVPDSKRDNWLDIVGAKASSIKSNKRLYCCEKHFDVQRDIEGYYFYKHFGGRIKLENHAYPYKNLGVNITVPAPQLPITIEQLPQTKESDEAGDDESVDPLATPTTPSDRENENGSEGESFSDSSDNEFNGHSDSDTEDSKVDKQLPRSEEIIVTSDVYVQDDHDDEVDTPPEIKTEIDSTPDPFVNLNSDEINSGQIDANHNCPQCEKILSSAKSLKRHMKSVHDGEGKIKREPAAAGKNTVTCKECESVFTTRDEYHKHKSTHKKSFECDVCQKVFQTRFRLSTHYVMHMTVKSFLCEVCSRPFARASTLRRHRYTHATEKRFVCETCGRRFPAQYLLKLHITQSHTDAATVMCAQCSKVFTTNAHLKIHMNVHHSEVNPYKCEICQLQFNHPSALLRHRKRFHDPTSSFPCKECPKKFTQQILLERHMKTHPIKSMQPPQKVIIRCEECGITLCRPDRLRAHLAKLHNPANPHKCDTCRQTFPTEILMNQHAMRLHAPEYEYIYKCYICPKKYNQEAALKRHVKLHTDPKKPVTCELCGKILGRPNRLKPHMRALHSPYNPFKCDICLQTFREQKMLDSHTTQVHEQTILCQYCDKTFGKRDGLRQHLRRNHSEMLSLARRIKLE